MFWPAISACLAPKHRIKILPEEEWRMKISPVSQNFTLSEKRKGEGNKKGEKKKGTMRRWIGVVSKQGDKEDLLRSSGSEAGTPLFPMGAIAVFSVGKGLPLEAAVRR